MHCFGHGRLVSFVGLDAGFCVGRGRGNSCVSTRDYLIVTPQEVDQGAIGGFMMRRLLARGRGSALAFPMVFDCVGHGRVNSASLDIRDYRGLPD